MKKQNRMAEPRMMVRGVGKGTCKPSPSEEETFAETWPSGRCLSQMELTAGAKAQRQELS